MLINRFQLNTEKQLIENYHTVITDFWDKNTQENYFLGVDNKEIYTVSIKTGNSKAIVISPGRSESALKYKELAFDLNRQGYDIYIIDHRGQGLSQRLGGDQNKGHVEQFQDYIDDLNAYISSLKLALHYQNNSLLAHSMGGTIAALYLQQFDSPFQAVVLFSPMFSIKSAIPNAILKIITLSSATMCNWARSKPCSIPGEQEYKKKKFTNNDLTSSKLRFSLSLDCYETTPQIQLGSPTMRWVSESISAAQQAISNADKITVPILIIQAGADSIVTSDGHTQFLKNIKSNKTKKIIKIVNSKHEVLLEQDQYRIPALNEALQFIKESINLK